jgi:hypothetical protein
MGGEKIESERTRVNTCINAGKIEQDASHLTIPPGNPYTWIILLRVAFAHGSRARL